MMNKNIKKKKKIIAIIGPTASGKTGIGVQLALDFSGEIISADSRQVYQGMDIGTGKDLDEYIVEENGQKVKVPYHLIDVVNPMETFDLAQYQKLANLAIQDIIQRQKLPIVVGGTGLYLQALVDNYQLSNSGVDLKLRAELEKKDLQELQKLLEKKNKELFTKLNNSDKNNKRRLVRYLEIIEQGGQLGQKTESEYDWLIIGLTWPKDILQKRIKQRLLERLEQENMVAEVEKLHQEGVSWQRLESFGLEYRYLAYYLQKKISYNQMVEELNTAIVQFAKRQMTWYHRWEKQGQAIYWSNDYEEIKDKVSDFLNK